MRFGGRRRAGSGAQPTVLRLGVETKPTRTHTPLPSGQALTRRDRLERRVVVGRRDERRERAVCERKLQQRERREQQVRGRRDHQPQHARHGCVAM